jgi:hypothetical protein
MAMRSPELGASRLKSARPSQIDGQPLLIYTLEAVILMVRLRVSENRDGGQGMKLARTGLVLLLILLAPHHLKACNSPLVFDLEGDDYIVTTSPQWYPLLFDINGDGQKENTGWLAGGMQQGFLWLDLNRNGIVDGGQELFGTATVLPTGERAANGFQALAVYDATEFGGNGDGVIDERDLVWPFLRMWVDDNFDGRSQKKEVRPLAFWKIAGISLRYTQSRRVDGNMNVHELVGTYFKRLDGREGYFEVRPQRIEDIFFRDLPAPAP